MISCQVSFGQFVAHRLRFFETLTDVVNLVAFPVVQTMSGKADLYVIILPELLHVAASTLLDL